MIIVKNRITESKNVWVTGPYYHGDIKTNLKSLIQKSTKSKTYGFDIPVVWITQNIAYASAYATNNSKMGSVYEVESVGTLDIFNAGDDNDWQKLFHFRTPVHGISPRTDILIDMALNGTLKSFRRQMATNTWGSMMHNGKKIPLGYWVAVVSKMGYQGYLNYEDQQRTLGIFNADKNLVITKEIPLENLPKLYPKIDFEKFVFSGTAFDNFLKGH